MCASCSALRPLIAGGCFALFLVPVYAEEPVADARQQQTIPFVGDVFVLQRGSTLGFGPEVSKNLSPKIDFRVGFESLRDIENRTKRNVRNRFDLKLRSFSFLLDWHPFGGSFRTSVGVLINRHRLRADAVPTETLSLDSADLSDDPLNAAILHELNLTTLSVSDSLTIKGSDLLTVRGRVRFNNFAPYLGIGWGNTTREDRRLHYTFDLGLAFHGSPEVELDVGGPLARVARQHAGPELSAFLASEERQLEDDLNDADVFPVVSFGLSYHF